MIADLRVRAVDAVELMDLPDCDLAALRRTYARFRLVNRLVSGWRRCYRERIRPQLSSARSTSLLDIGSGGGDLPRALRGWAREDGLRLEVVAVDPDPRAAAYVADQPPTPGVSFRQAASADLVAAGERYDLVVSNHLLHHLDRTELDGLLADSERLADRLVLHNDLRRSHLAYLGWSAVSWPAARDSFLYTDGLRSIRRSYRPDELVAVLPAGWQVLRQAPFRLLLAWSPARGASRG